MSKKQEFLSLIDSRCEEIKVFAKRQMEEKKYYSHLGVVDCICHAVSEVAREEMSNEPIKRGA